MDNSLHSENNRSWNSSWGRIQRVRSPVRLGIEHRTVKAYVGRLMRKTGADNRIRLSMSALNRSLAAAEHMTGAAGVARQKVPQIRLIQVTFSHSP